MLDTMHRIQWTSESHALWLTNFANATAPTCVVFWMAMTNIGSSGMCFHVGVQPTGTLVKIGRYLVELSEMKRDTTSPAPLQYQTRVYVWYLREKVTEISKFAVVYFNPHNFDSINGCTTLLDPEVDSQHFIVFYIFYWNSQWNEIFTPGLELAVTQGCVVLMFFTVFTVQ